MRDRYIRGFIILFVLLSITIAAWVVIRSVPRAIGNFVAEKRETNEDLTVLVTQIRKLSRLETASMRVMHVSTLNQSYGMIPDRVAGDKITFMAVGDVIAGIDLSQIRREDVRVDRDGVLTLELPASTILVTRVDNQQSRVLHRDTGLLRKADVDMESRVRAHAENSIRDEAVNKGILTMASDNAEEKLAEFLNAVGFEKVRFERARPRPAKGG
ncbi:MAG TPA: DUF4230 domain-containing protein [Thermoanaerobaculia bacterium]|nr:DUF4230 domain-containing protein [Thermoanaerobaculia bacterium]